MSKLNKPMVFKERYHMAYNLTAVFKPVYKVETLFSINNIKWTPPSLDLLTEQPNIISKPIKPLPNNEIRVIELKRENDFIDMSFLNRDDIIEVDDITEVNEEQTPSRKGLNPVYVDNMVKIKDYVTSISNLNEPPAQELRLPYCNDVSRLANPSITIQSGDQSLYLEGLYASELRQWDLALEFENKDLKNQFKHALKLDLLNYVENSLNSREDIIDLSTLRDSDEFINEMKQSYLEERRNEPFLLTQFQPEVEDESNIERICFGLAEEELKQDLYNMLVESVLKE